MRQKAYNSVTALMNAGTKLSAGADILAVALGLVVGTKPLIDADHLGLSTANDAHLAGVGVLRDRREALEQATEAAYALTTSIRDALKRTLGRKYSSLWEGTGFNGSLRIKRSVAPLEGHLSALKRYLTDHPALEVAAMATSTLADAALDALTAASTAVTVQEGVVRTLLGTRKVQEKKMRQRIRAVVVELTGVLGELDGRWETFGLNQPGLKQAPPKPENVAVALIGSNALMKWDKTPRAEYYRVWVKLVGVDTEAKPAGSPADNNFAIENPAPNALYEVSISALNNGGESLRSTVLTFQTP